jgi:exopolysaccharide biosynthesis polyprenyl glycosylphosphotransferase
MLRDSVRLARMNVLLVDALAALLLFQFVSMWRFGDAWREVWLTAGAPWWAWGTAYAGLWAFAEWLQALDQLRARWTFRGEVLDILRAVLLLAVSVFSLLFLSKSPEVSRLFLVTLFLAQVGFSVVERGLIRLFLLLGRRSGTGRRNILVVGTNEIARSVASRLVENPMLGYRVVGFIGPAGPEAGVIGSLDELEAIVGSNVVDEVLVALEPDDVGYVDTLSILCREVGKRLRVVAPEARAHVLGGRSESFGGYAVTTIANGPDRTVGLLAKRTIDVTAASLALVLLSPVLVAIAVAVRVDNGGPVLFRQGRVGRNGRIFRIIKFRTMSPDAEGQLAALTHQNEIAGHAFKLVDDPRVTRVGRILRRTSLDELPQFANVVMGQMSIVGPRPPLPTEVAGYDRWHRRRLSMKPGITGLWQVSARRDGDFDRWVELDLRYIDRWSLWLDLKIMVRTLPAMLTGR